MTIEVDGVDYSIEGIKGCRQTAIEMRDHSMTMWPDSIPFTLFMTHNIALLSHLIELKGGTVQ